MSAFVFGGVPARAVHKAFSEMDVFVSPALLEEYRAVPQLLQARGKIDAGQFKALLAGIAAFVAEAVVTHPRRTFNLCRDPSDDMLLDCCFSAHAAVLVTGDDDLLCLHDLPFDLNIMTPRQFL